LASGGGDTEVEMSTGVNSTHLEHLRLDDEYEDILLDNEPGANGGDEDQEELYL